MVGCLAVKRETADVNREWLAGIEINNYLAWPKIIVDRARLRYATDGQGMPTCSPKLSVGELPIALDFQP
jgi:hypothetical protein